MLTVGLGARYTKKTRMGRDLASIFPTKLLAVEVE